MDFRQIEAFIKVVELASFSRAAEALHVSQPSISTYITSLEKELGVQLINRSTKVLSTTPAGERFLKKARDMMALKRESIEALKGFSADVGGELRILASSVPAVYMLPGLLAAFHRQHPGVSFSMAQADTARVVRGIADCEADIGFAGSRLSEKKCVFHEFANETLTFIAPNDGSYRPDREYALDELLYANSFIAREFGSGTRIQYEKYFAENGIALDKIKTCASMDSTHGIINAVMSGLGISIVSTLAVRQLFAHGLLMPLQLKGKAPERKLYAVFNRSIVHSHLVERFMDFAAESIAAQAKACAYTPQPAPFPPAKREHAPS